MTPETGWPLLAAAATLGFAGSAHCVGMCGGIAAAGGTGSNVLQGILFNLGRLAGYALLGGGVGALVGAALGGLPVRPFAIGLRLLAALLMLLLGIALLTGRDLLSLERLGAAVWRRLRPLAGRSLALPGGFRLAVLGVLWGFLPCGLVYSAISLAAAAGSAAAGSLAMLAFGLGTLPAMLAVTLAGSAVTRRFAGLRTRRLAGLLMIGFAIWTAFGFLGPHPPGHGGTPPAHEQMGH